MYNYTGKVLPYVSQVTLGAILPYSDKVLSTEDVDKKIKKVKNHIAHLMVQQSHKNMDGGKRVRTRKIVLQNQISSARDRLKFYQMVKATIPKV